MSIADEKLTQIKCTVSDWLLKTHCKNKELQSLLGQLLYVNKCVRLFHTFLNRMLDLLHANHDQNAIKLIHLFCGDLG